MTSCSRSIARQVSPCARFTSWDPIHACSMTPPAMMTDTASMVRFRVSPSQWSPIQLSERFRVTAPR